MCTKVGFFTRQKLDANVLKYIIASFPYILKNKGTAKGIEYAVNTILKAENTTDEFQNPYILIVNKATSSMFTDYTVYIYTTVDVYNRIALQEVLKYVLPVGYKYQLYSYARLNDGDAYTQFTQSDEYKVHKAFVPYVSSVRSKQEESSEATANYRYQSAYDVSEVMTAEMASIADSKETISTVSERTTYTVTSEETQ